MLTDKEKVAKYDQIAAILATIEEDNRAMKVYGTLSRKLGIKGFQKAEVGEYVYQKGDRYIIVMETLDGKDSAEIPYYINTLQPYIDPLTDKVTEI